MRKNNLPIVYRYDIYYADLSAVVGSEQGGLRPVVILQNDIGNRNAPTTIIAPLTSVHTKAKLPTHVVLAANETWLKCESVLLLEQVRTIDKQRLKDKVGFVAPNKWEEIEKALKISLGLTQSTPRPGRRSQFINN